MALRGMQTWRWTLYTHGSGHRVVKTHPQAGPPGIVHHLPISHSARLYALRHYVTIHQAAAASAARLAAPDGMASRARRRDHLA